MKINKLSKVIILFYICFIIAITVFLIPTNAYHYYNADNSVSKYYKSIYKPIWEYAKVHKINNNALWLYKRDYGQITLYISALTLICGSILLQCKK